MKERNDTVSLNKTGKMNEHAEQHSEPVLTDDHIEKSNDLHTDVLQGPDKSELIIKAPEQNPENTDSSSLATRQIEPTLIVSSSDGTSYVPTNQAEFDTHQGEAVQRAHKHVAETILEVNRSSINTLKADPTEQSSKNLPVPSDTQVDHAASVSGDNHSILSQKSTADEPKEFEKHTPIPPGVISSLGPGAGPDSGTPQVPVKGRGGWRSARWHSM
ncbi:hypothetical protein N7488_001296 [Penicillium malachiteum]|nr:hypothetical protein N7488_001296 [Penicillium malachiteum]